MLGNTLIEVTKAKSWDHKNKYASNYRRIPRKIASVSKISFGEANWKSRLRQTNGVGSHKV
jgi:hypothetical protein